MLILQISGDCWPARDRATNNNNNELALIFLKPEISGSKLIRSKASKNRDS